jgi:Putative Actinobacterial Holin-X, holin superfamily III
MAYQTTTGDFERTTIRTGDGVEARPTSDLVREMFQEGQHLLKEEIYLAKEEARYEAKQAGKAGAALGAGGAILYVGVMAFAGFLVAVGSTFLPLWLSALIVSVLFLAAGGIALKSGQKKIKEINPKNSRTVGTLKEDKEWARDTMQSVKSHRHAHA